MKTILSAVIACILLASCKQTYRVRPVGSTIVEVVDMEKGYHDSDIVVYKELSYYSGYRVVILNKVN